MKCRFASQAAPDSLDGAVDERFTCRRTCKDPSCGLKMGSALLREQRASVTATKNILNDSKWRISSRALVRLAKQQRPPLAKTRIWLLAAQGFSSAV
jgi:hypothetical protein